MKTYVVGYSLEVLTMSNQAIHIVLEEKLKKNSTHFFFWKQKQNFKDKMSYI